MSQAFRDGRYAAAARQLRQTAAILDIPAEDLERVDVNEALRVLENPDKGPSHIGGATYECHQELTVRARARGHGLATQTARGLLLPWGLFRTYQAGTANLGGNLVEASLQVDDPTYPLYPFAPCIQLGVTVESGFTGNPVFPIVSTKVTPAEAAESTQTSETESTFSNYVASPHIVTAWGKASRLFAQQAPPLDGAVKTVMIRSTAIELENEIINGAGAPQVTGLLNVSGTNAISGTSTNYATLCNAQTTVLDLNGLQDKRSAGWLASPDTASTLAQRYEDATSKVFKLWRGAIHTGTVLNDQALSSKLLPSATLIFGDWSAVSLAIYSEGIELAVNPFTGGSAGDYGKGDITYRTIVVIDCVARHPQSFSIISSIT